MVLVASVAALAVATTLAGPVAGATDTRANERPLAEAGLDRSVTQGAAVVLDGAGSRDPDGEIVAHRWTIEAPDGTPVTPECPTCERTTFDATQTGEYAVTLTVEDDDGATDSDTLYVQVDPADPPTVSLAGPTTVAVDDDPTYTADLTPGDLRVSHLRWTVDGRLVANRSPTDDTFRPSLDSEGEYLINVTAVDAVGNADSDSLTVRAVDGSTGDPDGPDTPDPDATPPTARFTLDRTTACVTEQVLADPRDSTDTDRVNGSTPPEAIDRTVWYVDGTRVTANDGKPPQSLSMDSPGDTRIRLVVEDDDGQRDSTTTTVEVLPDGSEDCSDRRSPLAVIQHDHDDDTVTPGTTLTVDGSASYDRDNPAADGSEIETYEWTIDGASLAGEQVQYTFDRDTTVRLTVTDDDGQTHTTTVDIATASRSGDGVPVGASIDGVEVMVPELVYENEGGYDLDYNTLSPGVCATQSDRENPTDIDCLNLHHIASDSDELSATLRYEKTEGTMVSVPLTSLDDITFRGVEEPGAHERTVEVTVREVGDGYYTVDGGVITDTDTVTFCTRYPGFEGDGSSGCELNKNRPLQESVDLEASTPPGPYGVTETISSSARITNDGKFRLEEITWEQHITTKVGGIGDGSGPQFSWSPTAIDYSASAVVEATVTAEEPSNAPYDYDVPEEWFTDSDTTGVTVCGTQEEIENGECENDNEDTNSGADDESGDGGSGDSGGNDGGSEGECNSDRCEDLRPSDPGGDGGGDDDIGNENESDGEDDSGNGENGGCPPTTPDCLI